MRIITCTTCLGQKSITIGLAKNNCPTCHGHGHFDADPKKPKSKKNETIENPEEKLKTGSDNGSE